MVSIVIDSNRKFKEKLRKYEVLHVHEGLDEEEIVYYV